ncbi:ER lumen protein-retaining receptor 3 isoform X2 [Arvicanthis niloticus]|uniref:ER lumen protein-retaining receptor 3 isoform X2 n=1 Tax=Arvicanthis niloticus TaxID=61156 RepID=UPI00402B5B11
MRGTLDVYAGPEREGLGPAAAVRAAPPVGVGTWEAPLPGSCPAPGRPATSPRGQRCARERGGAAPAWGTARLREGDVAAPHAPERSQRSSARQGAGVAGGTMNVFRILGDLSHLLAMILLLVKIWRSKSCAGISGKSQILFALVFTTRYLDLFSNFISIYNTVMKVVFLLCAYVTVYMIYWKFRKTFDIENDTFRLEFLLVPVIGLSFLENYSYAPMEVGLIPRQGCLSTPSSAIWSCLPLLTVHSTQPHPTVRGPSFYSPEVPS